MKKDFSKAKKLFHERENTQGYCLWQAFNDNSVIEAWNIWNSQRKTYEPHIVQFWDGDNGYSIYQHTFKP